MTLPQLQGTSADTGKVDSPSAAYLAMSGRWFLINDLMGGTLSMRAAGDRRLPRETKEDDTEYAARLERSYLYGAFKDTIQKLSARPFSKALTTKGVLPSRLLPILDDADLQGRDLTQFTRSVFEAGMTFGMSHILVDFPQTGGGLSLAAERASGVRPYLVHIKAQDLLAWRTERMSDGSERLTQIRFKERRVEYDKDGFGESTVEYVRVIEPKKWELWKKKRNEADFSKFDEGVHSFDGVPLVTFYTTQDDFMLSTPPLEDMAWLNLAHWQSLSDQRNILRFARLGILFAAGFSTEEVDKGIVIGPSKLTASTNPEAKLTYVEHAGKAIESGEKDLQKLEERMEVLGLQPLVQSTGNATATARAMDEARTHSNIQAWIRGLENTLLEAFAIAGAWVGVEVPDDFGVDIYSDFGIALSTSDDVKSLIAMKGQGLIQHVTFLDEVKRRGILSDSLDAESEVEAIGKTALDDLAVTLPEGE